jgi:hypothetical protein
MIFFHPLKSIVEPPSGNKNPLTKKKGVPYTPLEAPYCMTKDIPREYDWIIWIRGYIS